MMTFSPILSWDFSAPLLSVTVGTLVEGMAGTGRAEA